MGGRIFAWTLGLAGACALWLAPAAGASFHLIKVREVHPSQGEDSYVELQMYAAGQNFLGGHKLTLYDAAGSLVHTSTFSSGVANGQNQTTVLVGDSGVEASYGIAPDLVDSSLSVPAAGGAACWNAGGIPADCVAWGNFSGGAALQGAAGTSAGSPVSPGGITTGKAIRRTIEPGCPTLLEESDDSDASSADFVEVTPAPRNNASPIVETTCAGAPNTTIDDRPAAVTNTTSASFTYEAPTATSYECKLDGAAFSACEPDGVEYSGLPDGTHSFQVRGRNASGPDPTPATYSWRVDTVPPSATLDQAPSNPSPGASATFKFHASEANATFECSLAPAGQPDSFSSCTSGKTYAGLADGTYVFQVRAKDQAGNQQATPTAYSWTVDNSLADTTPPETTITAHPPDPSTSVEAEFAYSSNEAGSSFECSLDGAPFSSCPSAGASYSGLAAGPHSFQVRAIDASANVDPSPAGFSFQVVLTPPPLVAPQPPSAPQTLLGKKPPTRTRDRTPIYTLPSHSAGATFQCSLDKTPFRSCRSPLTTKPLAYGRHAFSVRASVAGAVDSTPARFRFRVVRGKR